MTITLNLKLMKTNSKTNSKQAVLITGASSGIGKATALYLDELGIKVYAGVRKEADKQSFLQLGYTNITPVILDVCDEDTLAITYDLISNEVDGFTVSLVNNAGLSLNGPLELLPLSDIKKLLDVNVTGLLAVTKTFLPLIRKNKGRIVNISSGHGLIAIPDKSVYAASKFAVQAITDSLRVELRPFGVSVSSVIVGKVNTSVLGKIMDDRNKMLEQAQTEIVNLYKQLIDYFDKEVKNIPGIEAIEVAKVISQALIHAKLKSQYLIGPGAKKMKVLSRFPSGMRDNMLYKAIYK